jgi:DNA-binding transcriptional LysR family regulator
LVRPLPHLLDGGSTYWLVYPEARSEWSKIRCFSAWLRDLCETAKVEPAMLKAVV